MPYTPPSSRSPAASANTSPNLSRRSSLTPSQQAAHSPQSSGRPDLPRSTSYLTRQRRSASVKVASFAGSQSEPSPPGTADSADTETNTINIHGSIRKSPPPVTDDSRIIPNAAVLSPPESTQNSSDDEECQIRSPKQETIAELKAAIQNIRQNRNASPHRQAAEVAKANQALTLIMPDSNDEDVQPTLNHIQRHLSVSARQYMHKRSNTDHAPAPVFMDLRADSNSEDESDDDSTGSSKPPMLRKKSGELVRPALRPASGKRRPSSMPGTPTFNKAVHFDSHLEHVRHFLQVDRPLAVSAGSSPVEAYESESEFPFNDEETKGPPFEWEIVVANFPADTPHRLSQPVRLERVFLSADNKNLIGTVAVANLAFNKAVVARFTLDYWKTTSEVVGEYCNDVRRKQHEDGYDRFNFNIKLADQANLEAKTMFFCVKFCVNGQEYWDNNNNTNFQVDFRKKARAQNGKRGSQGSASRPAHSLPRSNKKSPTGRSKVSTATFDDFSQLDSKFNFADFKKPINDLFDDAPNPTLRLKGVRSAVSISSDNLTRRQPNPNGLAFSNRYDFGASLSAAINAANTALGEKSGLPQDKKAGQPAPMTSAVPKSAPKTTHTANGADSPRPAGSEKPVLASQSYNELLDKYCFFGSAKSSPLLKDGTLSSQPGQIDGTSDSTARSHSPSPVNAGSPLQHPYQPAPMRTESARTGRSASPAPMTGFVTGTSPMYPYVAYGGSPFNEAYTATAIRG